MLETIFNLGIGALVLALIGYGLSSMGPTHLDYQIAKVCYSLALLLVVIIIGVWLISDRWSMGMRILTAFITCSIIGAGWATLIGIVQNREEYQKRIEAKKAYAGTLKAEKKIVLSSKNHIYPKVELGNSGAIIEYAGPKGFPLFSMLEVNNLIIVIEDKQLMLTAKIRDKTGNIIVEIVNNDWKVAPPPNTWDRNYSKNALEVRDPTGDIVLQVKLLEDRVQFQGKLIDAKGNGYFFGSVGPQSGGIIQKINFDRPEISPKKKPMFKYPSDLYFGEFVGPQ